jgi:hypothetical protein
MGAGDVTPRCERRHGRRPKPVPNSGLSLDPGEQRLDVQLVKDGEPKAGRALLQAVGIRALNSDACRRAVPPQKRAASTPSRRGMMKSRIAICRRFSARSIGDGSLTKARLPGERLDGYRCSPPIFGSRPLMRRRRHRNGVSRRWPAPLLVATLP